MFRHTHIDAKISITNSSQIALLQIFTNTLNESTTPATAAKQISYWSLSVLDSDVCYEVDRAYTNIMDVISSATSQFSARKHLETLADLMIEPANQPN